MTIRSVIGAFRILRRRSVEVGRPALGLWTDQGERAAVALGAAVRDGAHKAETHALEIERELRDVLADGKVTPSEIARLKRLPPRAHGVAETCHDVGEVAS